MRKRLLIGKNPEMQTSEDLGYAGGLQFFAPKKKGAEAPWMRWQKAAFGALPL
ncbi:hypothetical protein ACINB_38960 [Acidovorax sp. NB1]|nr:hypothetical protein ACINB_38960 [Acidovorax sp. NB1]